MGWYSGLSGEIIAEHEREQRYGDGTGSDLDDGFDTPLVNCAYTRGVAALVNHKPEPDANARYLFDEDRNVRTVAAIKDI